jgi:hypothetical protein
MKRTFTKPTNLILCFIALIFLFINSCKKDEVLTDETPDVSDIKNWYNLYTSNTTQDFAIFESKSSVTLLSSNNNQNKKNQSIIPVWEKAKVYRSNDSIITEVPISAEQNFIFKQRG